MPRISSPVVRAAISATFLALAAAPTLAQPPSNPSRTPVLVELFTSEGCSSCPPADALLARLLREQPVPAAEILVLEEHVDYWDSLGWRDRFSSHLFTDRQVHYTQRLRNTENYTPQMVVDGTDQFVGSDSAHALRAIARSARTPKPLLSVSPLLYNGTQLSGEVLVPPSSKIAPDAKLYAAVIEATASTHVQRGENGGRTLQHVSIVRTLQPIGTPAEATIEPLKFSVAVPKDAIPANLRIVVFLQSPDQGPILAAVSSNQAPTSTAPTSPASAPPQLPH